jgi:serine phosphatase RsbU (regulator of sigma subunit)
MKDSLWSTDLFRCESAGLRTHWILVVMDQYTRRIMGFGLHAGPIDGIALCRMFNHDFLDLSPGQGRPAGGRRCGKGLPAALLMASVHASIRTQAPLFGDRCGELLADLNMLLYEVTDTGMFATVFYGVYEERSRRLTYANAGHEAPLLLRMGAAPDAAADGAEAAPVRVEGGRPLTGPKCVRLDSRTPPVGLLPSMPALQMSLQLAPGDWLLIFTDGITEALNRMEQGFGRERLLAVIARNFDRTSEEMRDAILAELGDHSRGLPQSDDVTLVAAHVL